MRGASRSPERRDMVISTFLSEWNDFPRHMSGMQHIDLYHRPRRKMTRKIDLWRFQHSHLSGWATILIFRAEIAEKWKKPNLKSAWLTVMELIHINPIHMICFSKVFDAWHFQRKTSEYTNFCVQRHFSVKNSKNAFLVTHKTIFQDMLPFFCVQKLIFSPLL